MWGKARNWSTINWTKGEWAMVIGYSALATAIALGALLLIPGSPLQYDAWTLIIADIFLFTSVISLIIGAVMGRNELKPFWSKK